MNPTEHSQLVSPWVRNLPNALTILRVGLAVMFPFVSVQWRLAIVVVSAITDFLDGYLARKFNLSSWLGALLDGVADKAITLSVLLTFAIEGRLSWWALLLVMTRDLAVGAIAARLAWWRAWPEFGRMGARVPGKVTMVAIYLLMVVLLVAPSWAWIVLWPTGILSLLAAIDYAIIFLSVDPERQA